MPESRKERDFLGEVDVPARAYYGAQTQRAVENFPISGLRLHHQLVKAMALIKRAAAVANAEAGRLPEDVAAAIVQAADEVIEGQHADQFPVDAFQAGAGTSSHMNVNEVLANRAGELLGEPRGSYERVHPNDHVNLGQSTNDVFPTAMRLAALEMVEALLVALDGAADAFRLKQGDFARVVKSGRTHLQDATPIALGQEFGAYAQALSKCHQRLGLACEDLCELGIGGTAVGTGATTHEGYRQRVVEELARLTGRPLECAPDTFEAMQSMAPFVRLSGELRALATELTRICNDLRLLSSGPNTGIGEIALPAVQPGSSIMPGKVNPVIPECVNMVCFQVIGNDLSIATAAQAGQLELNVMMPVIGFNLLQSLEILTNGLNVLTTRCIGGITADAERCREHARASLGLATLLRAKVGYHAASELAREAQRTGKRIGDLALEKGLMTQEELDRLLSPDAPVPQTPPRKGR
ncbi:MAG: aspartate ammonia-lyase [Armatimonadota bacterium]